LTATTPHWFFAVLGTLANFICLKLAAPAGQRSGISFFNQALAAYGQNIAGDFSVNLPVDAIR
jgi:cytosine/uracil/thiamine/allantoin permease